MPKRKTLSLIIAILLAAGYWVLDNTELGRSWKEGGTVPTTPTGSSTTGGYQRLSGCTLVDHRNNDGDSFHVRHGDDRYEFRLYFVDAPESKYKTYGGGDDNGKRIRQQGAYFGGLDRRQTTHVGTEAKKFSVGLLADRPFTVFTKDEGVYGRERLYALVEVIDAAGNERFLSEMLVDQGLARIHTKGAALPDGTSRAKQEAKLRSIEHAARRAGVGAWRHARD